MEAPTCPAAGPTEAAPSSSERAPAERTALAFASTAASSSSDGQASRMPAKEAAKWSEAQVLRFFEGLGLGKVREQLSDAAVNGIVLCSLSEDEMVTELGLTKLQARKVMLYLR